MRVVRRTATGLLLAVPTALAPLVAVAAPQAPSAPDAPDRAVTRTAARLAQTSTPEADSPAQARPGKQPRPDTRPMRLAEYMGQKLTWSARTCGADAQAAARATSGAKTPIVVECARLKAPLDWSDLTKGSLSLHVTRVARPKAAATRGKARGLFVNPGGPGGAAGIMAPALAASKPALRTTHDIVGVDPRGTGLSTPLPCDLLAPVAPDYRRPNAATRAKIQASYRSWVRACVKKQGAILPYITTKNTVHDQDLVRRLMGYKTLDWMGLSGGTWMGAWYAQLHPTQAGRMVLDSNTQFTTDWRTSFADLPMGAQRRFERQFLPWLARQHRTYGLGRTTAATRASYEALRAQAGKGRITGITPYTLDLVIFQALYQDVVFPELAKTMSATTKALAKTKGAVRMPLPGEGMEVTDAILAMTTVRTAILCNDGPFERSPASFERETSANGVKYPLVGPNFGFVLGPCAYWPYKPGSAPRIDGSGGVPTMLMVQNQLDPATPIEGARRAHAAHRATRLVVARGTGGHGAFFTPSPNPCIDRITLAFLQRGTLPARDVECAGTPLPGEKKVYDVRTG